MLSLTLELGFRSEMQALCRHVKVRIPSLIGLLLLRLFTASLLTSYILYCRTPVQVPDGRRFLQSSMSPWCFHFQNHRFHLVHTPRHPFYLPKPQDNPDHHSGSTQIKCNTTGLGLLVGR